MRLILAAMAALALAACSASYGPPQGHGAIADYPEATPFDASTDSRLELEVALAAAAAQDASGQGPAFHVLAVFGANWCHDSRALAGWLETPRFRALTDEHFMVVFIESGVPQTGEGRNLELAEELRVSGITGTPTMLVIDANGRLLNSPEDAKGWRNAASRSGDEIFAWLEAFIAETISSQEHR